MIGDFNNRLLEATKDCRHDMHEPDEQGITAIVTGYDLDNSMGDNPINNCGEFTVAIICGHIYKELSLSERYWRCPNCHKMNDRDENASMNIRTQGIESLRLVDVRLLETIAICA